MISINITEKHADGQHHGAGQFFRQERIGYGMTSRRKALLLAGTGTLGGAVYPGLLGKGFDVDVVSLDDFVSVSPRLRFIKASVDLAMLEKIYADTPHYDVIVDFLHVADVDVLKKRIDLNLAHTDQFVYLSSYRTYSNLDAVVTERTPQWLDVTIDRDFLEKDSYAIPKSYGERHIRSKGGSNWTIIRPLISFSHYRLDLVTVGAYALLYRTRAGKRIPLPLEAKDKTAGVGWAGNVGRQIVALIGNGAALGEDFTLGTPETITWGDVASYYEEFGGCRFEWVPVEDYLRIATPNDFDSRQMIYTDRLLDRKVDLSKVLKTTGLDPRSFKNCRGAVAGELAFLSERPDLVRRFDIPMRHELDAKMDAYFAK